MSESDIEIISTDTEDNNQSVNNSQNANNNQNTDNNQNTNNNDDVDSLIEKIFDDDREADLFGDEEFINAVYLGK